MRRFIRYLLLLTAACSDPKTSPPELTPPPPPLSGPREPPPSNIFAADEPYLQEFNTPRIPGLERPAIAVFAPSAARGFVDEVVVVEESAIRTRTSTIVALPAGAFISAAATADAIYALTADRLFRVDRSGTSSSTISGAVKLGAGRERLWIFADDGLHLGDLRFPGAVAALEGDGGALYVATSSAVSKYVRPEQPAAWTIALPADFGTPVAMVADLTLPEPLELVVTSREKFAAITGDPPAIKSIPDFGVRRVPYLGINALLKLSGGGFIAATSEGAMRLLDRGDGPEWRVYNADRWIRSKDVRAVAATENTEKLWLATAAGISEVEARAMTLEEKMGFFIERIEKRHDRDGAVADSHLLVRGDLSTNIPWDSDNDGSWTSYWMRAECLRYRVTNDPRAKTNFDRALDAMLRLRDVTGTDYFLARAVIRKSTCNLDDCDNPDDGTWFTSPDGAWWVKADTSNDEVIAHIGVMGHVFDQCADDAQKQRIRDHVAGIMGGIIEHGYQLVDLDGLVTTYGQFDPEYVDSIPGIFGDGGLRAAIVLAGITLAYHLTGEARFYDAKRELITRYEYDTEAATELERPGRRAVMDNDDMGVWSKMILLRYEPDDALYAKWRDAWGAEWDAKFDDERAAWWDVVHAENGGEVKAERIAAWLRSAPMDMIRWNIDNSARRDLVRAPQPYFDPDGKQRSNGTLVPYDERPTNRWNTDSFHTEGGFDGMIEMDGADVLAPYWMARAQGWIR